MSLPSLHTGIKKLLERKGSILIKREPALNKNIGSATLHLFDAF